MAAKDPERVDPSILAGKEGQEGLPLEVKRRYGAYKAGKTKPLSLEEMFSDL